MSFLTLTRGVKWWSLLACSISCAANTTYRGVPPRELTDEQLIEELESAAKGFGIEVNRSMYLMAIRPEPAYVLTSSTSTFSGSFNATYNAYAMPVGYGAAVSGHSSGTVNGSTTTRYQYTDVNASARLGNSIATAITESKREAYKKRGLEILQEYQSRVSARRAETERLIEEFFAQNPGLQRRRTLLAVVAPWAAVERGPDSYAILQRSKEIVLNLPAGEGLSGRWYGTLAQTSRTANGNVLAMSEFVRIDLEQQGEVVAGHGLLGTGEVIELSGSLTQGDINATVANTTSGINVKLKGITAPSQITGSYVGSGAGVSMEGTFTLLR